MTTSLLRLDVNKFHPLEIGAGPVLESCDGKIGNGQKLANETIAQLLSIVGNDDKGCRQEALKVLLVLGFEQIYQTLERGVRSDADADFRNGAMETLVAFGAPAVPRLSALLADENEEVRNLCTVMLGNIGSRTAVTPLIHSLRDPDANVRHGAAEALAKIGDHRAVVPLVELLQGDFWDYYYASAALEQLGHRGPFPDSRKPSPVG